MARIIAESVFDVGYLITAAVFGVLILRAAQGRRSVTLFGVLTLILAGGDAFHLVPRVWGLNTAALERLAAALGFGTLVTSITMTVFYVLLYQFWRARNTVRGKAGLSVTVYLLAALRIVLCLFPENAWLSADAAGPGSTPWLWGIVRNIPFAALGILIIALFVKTRADRPFRFMPLAIALSFAFYIPVVLWVDVLPAIGMLMLPKTCAYVWMIVMGWRAAKRAEP
jgi:hypothetical protein